MPTKAPRDVSHVLKDKHHHLWKTETHEQHDKNHKLLVLSVHFPINDEPKDKQILMAVLVSTVNNKSSESDIYDLCVRLCANGDDQIDDLEDSHSPVCLADSLRITVVLVAAFWSSLSSLDVVNSHQNTILTEEQISHIYPPPFYVEWFRSRHPAIKLPGSWLVKLVVQAMSALQGAKSAVKLWNERLNYNIDTFDIKLRASDYGSYIWYCDSDIIILDLSDNDIWSLLAI